MGDGVGGGGREGGAGGVLSTRGVGLLYRALAQERPESYRSFRMKLNHLTEYQRKITEKFLFQAG